MEDNQTDYKFCINIALDNAKKRISILDKPDRKCLLEEYKEWFNDGISFRQFTTSRGSII